MLLGMLATMLAGVWKFMTREDPEQEDRPLTQLFTLMDRVREAQQEADLTKAEHEIDNILRSQMEQFAPGEIDAGEAAAVSLATHRLEHLVSQRRAALRNGGAGSVYPVRALQASAFESVSNLTNLPRT